MKESLLHATPQHLYNLLCAIEMIVEHYDEAKAVTTMRLCADINHLFRRA